MMKWSETSIKRMTGVHPELISVANRALSYQVIDMIVLPDGGVRTVKRQQELVAKGASKTLKSKHLIQKDGYGHALDLAPFPIDWDDIERFRLVSVQMFKAAKELNVGIEWGGAWKSFPDFPHYQIKGAA